MKKIIFIITLLFSSNLFALQDFFNSFYSSNDSHSCSYYNIDCPDTKIYQGDFRSAGWAQKRETISTEIDGHLHQETKAGYVVDTSSYPDLNFYFPNGLSASPEWSKCDSTHTWKDYPEDNYSHYSCVGCPTADNPKATESFTPDQCPPSDTIQQPTCLVPCEAGTHRNAMGGCCPDGFGMFCTASDGFKYSESSDTDSHSGWHWSSCADTNQDNNGTCPSGQEKDRFGACVAMCPAGQYRDLTNECSPIPDCADNEDFNTTSAQCEAKPQNPDDDNPNCTECEERGQQRLEECSKLGNGSFLEGFKCQENETCEVTTYNAGVCTDNDNDPRDPNYGDGSQENNDNTDDIPNSTEENLTQTTQTNDDGTQTTTTTQRNYDDALEAIGDNIDDSRKATNAQTEANKENTEFLGKKIDATNEHLKDINDKLDQDAKDSEMPSGYSDFISQVQTDIASVGTMYSDMKSTLQGNPIVISTANKGVAPDFEMDFHGKKIKISLCNSFQTFRPFLQFIFTLMLTWFSLKIYYLAFENWRNI